MVFLGLIIVIVAIVLGAEAVRENSGGAHLTLLDRAVPGVSTDAHVLGVGAIVGVVFMIGLMIAWKGAGRAMRDRRDLGDLRDDHDQSVSVLLRENGHLRREVQRLRSGDVPPDTRTQAAGMPFFDAAET